MLRLPALLATTAIALSASAFADAFSSNGYQRPSPALVEAVDRQNRLAPTTDNFDQGSQMQSQMSPDRKFMALGSSQAFAPLAEHAQSVWRTRDLNFSINTLTRRYAGFSITARKLELLTIASGELRTVELPADARVGATAWSHDGRHLAVVLYRNAPGEVWVVDAGSGRARRLTDAIVNSISYPLMQWVDATTLLVAKIARTPGEDVISRVPKEPDIADFDGTKTPDGYSSSSVRVAPLRPDEREKLIAFKDAEFVTVDLQGTMRDTGIRGAGLLVKASPDGRYLLVDQVYDPLVGSDGAPRRVDVYDRSGARIITVFDRREAVTDGGFFNYDVVTPGRRNIVWHPEQPARLQWLVAREDAAKRDTGIDELYVLDAPFSAEPRMLYRSDRRIQDIFWLPQGEFLAFENQVGTKTSRLARVRVVSGVAQVKPVIDYTGPPDGAIIPRMAPFREPTPIMRRNAFGREVPHLSSDGRYGYTVDFFRTGLSRLDLNSGRLEPLIKESKFSGSFIDFVDDNARVALFFANRPGKGNTLVRRDLASGKEAVAYTFPRRNLLPETAKLEVVTTSRADGLPLRAKVYTPPGWTKAQGPLPAMFWVYARRYETRQDYDHSIASIDAAAVNDESSLHFDMRLMSLAGYAHVVFNPPILPKTPEQSPYEAGWNEQMVEGTRRMIEYLAEQGIVDPKRVAAGGQSGGGYTTANLLAHSDLFRAGIACNGLYNRTLSPFGVALFEERSLWQVPKNYIEMSPLFHADKIQAPLLILKGQDENHPSIHPAESANLFGALKGLGKTARYVEFPLEEHSNIAYESVLHQLWEMERWLQMYLGAGWKPSEQ